MRSSASAGTQQQPSQTPQHVTTYANNPSSSTSASAYNTPHSSLPPPPPIQHLQPHAHQPSSRSMPLPHAASMHAGPAAVAPYGHQHSHHSSYAPGAQGAGSAAVMPAHSQVLPTPPPPGTVRLDDYMIAMEARFLSSQDKYYDKAVRELDKYIRDLQDDADNEFNLALHDQCAIIQERVHQHQLHLEYTVSQAELMYKREIEASQAQLEAESEATKQKMLSELAVKKRRLEEERAQDSIWTISTRHPDHGPTVPSAKPTSAAHPTMGTGTEQVEQAAMAMAELGKSTTSRARCWAHQSSTTMRSMRIWSCCRA
ncbi:hypothetical protein BCR44DRAFT_1022538 [Catenaria anguillulae PL171]|uniref:Sds3-like-domain-containing protein n=1 Tax=Catenaria anguillulae PL171 TaxID=765915 RepID=A0A1Y2H641_9FUNG|nr:hypothetical protein BCR44DRAFT_1022538 [Catenaria anguillulae PL171]